MARKVDRMSVQDKQLGSFRRTLLQSGSISTKELSLKEQLNEAKKVAPNVTTEELEMALDNQFHASYNSNYALRLRK
jgi:hypothetical protein